jgi:histidine ammonia-lyase
LRAPDVGKVPDEQQETAADMLVRYDTDAARSATVWKNAETLRISLAGRGMALNAQTATAVGRFQLLYEEAATAIKEHNWAEALSSLQAAEATTQKVANTVGGH